MCGPTSWWEVGPLFFGPLVCALGRIRTPGLWNRNPTLYPTELLAQIRSSSAQARSEIRVPKQLGRPPSQTRTPASTCGVYQYIRGTIGSERNRVESEGLHKGPVTDGVRTACIGAIIASERRGHTLTCMSEVLADVSVPRLEDEWERSTPIPLNGWFERNTFPPLLMAFIGLVVAFLLFQIVLSPIALVVLLMLKGVPPTALLEDLPALIEEQAATLLVANTIGQFLGLALPAYLLSRMHTSRPSSFLRLRGADLTFVLLAFGGLVALTPVIQWLGVINENLPLPDFVRSFEESQMELIERVLSVDTGILFNLAVLAITPAICEELLFRGYVQRQAERGLGIVGGVLFSGIVFGLYHLRLSQAIPLCVLGIYLAWLVWRTGSLWPAIIVHFANNAFAVAIGAYIARDPDLEMADLEQFEVPWYFLVLGLVLFGAVVVGIQRLARRLLEERTVGQKDASVYRARNPSI